MIISSKPARVLVLGASGMLGNAVLRELAQSSSLDVFGSVRSPDAIRMMPHDLATRLVSGVHIESGDELIRLFADLRPDIVVNCVGIIKQLAESHDALSVIPINSLLPHRLAGLCTLVGARLVQISTDCVFSGQRGMYNESDLPDAKDLYGLTKYLGEVNYPHTITLRTSIIGHELAGSRSLVGWFLAQKDSVKGFRRAIFSGLPTVEVARLIRDYVIPRPDLHGLYHVSAEPIDKFALLSLVAQTYGKDIHIEPDDVVVIDRSLDSTRFRSATGFKPKSWPELVCSMHEFG